MADPFAELIARLNKESKAHAVTSHGLDLTLDSHVPYGIPTRIPMLDLSIGRPGYPVGRSVELFGFEATGKTTAALHALAVAQSMGGLVHFLDSEKAWWPERAQACGLNPGRTIVSDVDSIEAMFRTIESALENLEKMGEDKPYVVAVDSITGVLSEHELEKEIGEEQRIGQDARILRHGMRKLTTKIAERNALALFVNHATEKVDRSGFGEKSQAAGGHAIKLYSSIRCSFAFMQQMFDGKGVDRTREGQLSRLAVKKNKVSKTGRPDFSLELTDTGFDLVKGLFTGFEKLGLLTKTTAQSYHFKPAEATVTKRTWPALVEERGGAWEMYKYFLTVAQELGVIKPYGTMEPVETGGNDD